MRSKIFKNELSIGQVAKRSGLNVSAIHFYEDKGLITSRRTDGNQRVFSREILRVIALIKVAQKLGIPLAEIKKTFSEISKEETPTPATWRKLSTVWRIELDQRIQKLTELRDQLGSCIGCGCLSMRECPLRNPEDKLSKQGSGPRLLKN